MRVSESCLILETYQPIINPLTSQLWIAFIIVAPSRNTEGFQECIPRLAKAQVHSATPGFTGRII